MNEPTAPSATIHVELGFLNIRVRNESLYYDERGDRSAADQFTIGYASSALQLVHQFAGAV